MHSSAGRRVDAAAAGGSRARIDAEDARWNEPLREGMGRVCVRVYSEGRELVGIPLVLYDRGPEAEAWQVGSRKRFGPLASGEIHDVPFGTWGMYNDNIEPGLDEVFAALGREAVRIDPENPHASIVVDVPYAAHMVELALGHAGGAVPGNLWCGLTFHAPGSALTFLWEGPPYENRVLCVPEGDVTIKLTRHGANPVVRDMHIAEAQQILVPVR